jgi:hypothetical protein
MAASESLNVFVCTGPVCGQAGLDLARAARDLAKDPAYDGRLSIQREVCLGYCHQGPNVMLCENADAWGHAPLAGTPGTKVLHEMDLAKLRHQIDQSLTKS